VNAKALACGAGGRWKHARGTCAKIYAEVLVRHVRRAYHITATSGRVTGPSVDARALKSAVASDRELIISMRMAPRHAEHD